MCQPFYCRLLGNMLFEHHRIALYSTMPLFFMQNTKLPKKGYCNGNSSTSIAGNFVFHVADDVGLALKLTYM